jgi:hypothetical protein
MLFFGRKAKSRAGARGNRDVKASGRQASADGEANLAGDTRRVTLSLSRAGKFAAMMARSRASLVIEVSDLLAGMYISDWEHLSRYWEEEDQDHVEDMMRRFCAMSPQRWNSWIELYDREQRNGKGAEPWRGPKPPARKPSRSELPLQKSVALEDVLKQAEQIAPYSDRDGDRKLPILTNEAVLLCVARSYGTEISRALAASGIDTARLEKDALFPRRAPLV